MRVSFLCTGLMVFLVAVVSSPPAAAAKGCYHGRGHIIKKMARGFEIQISRYPDKDNPELDECEAEIYDPRGDVIFSEHDWGFSIGVAGYDVNGDGIPDVVLEAYSGGAHCCWTFYVISLGSKPGLITKFENNRDAAFFWNKENRRIEIAPGTATLITLTDCATHALHCPLSIFASTVERCWILVRST